MTFDSHPPTVSAAVSPDDVPLDRLADLAKLHLSAEEKARLREQLASILTLIEELRATDTKGISPLSHAGDLTLRMRNDEVTETDQRQNLLPLAPQSAKDFYLVPPYIE